MSLTPAQERLLRLVHQLEKQNGTRPKGLQLFLILHKEHVEYEATRDSLPWRFFSRDGSQKENEVIGLALEGLHQLSEERPLIDAFLATLRLACRRFRDHPREVVRITHEDVREILGPLPSHEFLRALSIVSRDFSFGGTSGSGTWQVQLDVAILCYESVERIEDFFQIRDAWTIAKVEVLQDVHLEVLRKAGSRWETQGEWLNTLDYVLSHQPASAILRTLREVPDHFMSKVDFNESLDKPLRLSVDGLAIAGNAGASLDDFARLVALLCKHYEDTLGEESLSVEELAGRAKMPLERVNRLVDLIDREGLAGAHLDRSRLPWTFRFESWILEYSSIRNFDEFVRRRTGFIRKGAGVADVSEGALKKTLLDLFSKLPKDGSKSLNRSTVLGRPYQEGDLERALRVKFLPEERAFAGRILKELEEKGLVIPTHADVVSPLDWLVLSKDGWAMVEGVKSVMPQGGTPSAHYDAFLCHASEDKQSVVLPFSKVMEANGLKPWLDAGEVTWGDDLVKKIEQGLSKSRFVIAFISDAFLGKDWPEKELSAAISLEHGSKKVLPIVLGVSHEELEKAHPLVAVKLYKAYRPYDRTKPFEAAHLDNLLQALKGVLSTKP